MAKFERGNAHRSAKAQLEALGPGMKVGLFGGSFNPAHLGHLHLAETARKRLGLERILWLVSPGNPLKDPTLWQGYQQRVDSARNLIQAHTNHFVCANHFVCQSETAFGTRYTLDTVRGLQGRWPGVHFVWLMGADNLANFHHWRDWQDIATRIPIAIIARPTDPVLARLSPFSRQFATARLPEPAAKTLAGRNPPAWVYLCAPYDFGSSTAIREHKGHGAKAGAVVQANKLQKPKT